MKKTAVEWFVEKLPLIQQEGLRDEIEQAKEMEKEQIINAHGDEQSYLQDDGIWIRISGTEYYNETFKNETK
jgi:hypothetical protein